MKYSLLKHSVRGSELRFISKQLLKLAIPSMAENLLQMLFGMVDTAFLGHLSWQAMSGAGLANQLIFVFQVVVVAAAVGVNVIVSNATGVGNKHKASGSLWNGVHLCLLWSAALMILAPFSSNFLKIFGNVDSVVFDYASTYLKTILFGMPSMAMMAVLGAALRGSGDTKTPMFVTGIANSLNVFLDYAMIYGKFGFPRMEVFGAALATVISRFVGSFMLLLAIMKNPHLNEDVRRAIKLDLANFRDIVSVGLPAAGENFMFSSGLLIFASILLASGPMAYAGHRIGISIESLSFMPGWGISVAVTTLAGQYNGRRRLDKVTAVARQGFIIAALIQVSVGVFIFLFPELLINLFTNQAEILQLAKIPVRLVGLFQIFLALESSMNGVLRATGNTTFGMIVSTVSMWAIRLPLAYLFSVKLGLGLLGAWLGMMIDMSFRSVVKLLFYMSGSWEKMAMKVSSKVTHVGGSDLS
ncbi:multidrug transporter MatE [Pseudothermotoga hypogea DSM 11164 = NBRC 106472]|uniref:Multidrug-efflux transporter n=1 Tax=Pseudothermotoga hypogea DSM 11164 = NBRC 106472 TaxID=1123384 RepID=A0A0X1KPB1_9THEM|nr:MULTISPECIES: MATE family efflux transporter [Pseudothermotoga]AJC73081.1 multidrug transporter MatE [Pseudothermotoga hypogea DSM 11164 = NBRC 106472]MDI6861762.1 MATE family efflux transporter [Pseudothermotoga sp.]